MPRRWILAVLTFLSLTTIVVTPAARAQWDDSRHYMVVFGTQSTPNTARSSHTYATFVHVLDGRIVAEDTISWLPAPGYFGPGYTMPPVGIVPGMNYSLDATLAMYQGGETTFWGPYEITPQFYDAALARIAFLASRQTSYKMFVTVRDRLRQPALSNRPGGAINCIMAVSDLGGYLDTGTDWGFAASEDVVAHLARFTYDYPRGPHSDVAELMDLQRRIDGR